MLIAYKSLDLQMESGLRELPIRIFAPVEDDGSWMCRIEIDWPEGQQSLNSGGVDSMQALTLALYYIGSSLNASDYHKTGQLRSPPSMDGYGFPVPFSMREDLRPGDARFV